MSVPSPKSIQERLVGPHRLDPSATTTIHDAMKKAQCGGAKALDSALELINRVLHGYGIEALRGDRWDPYYGDVEALYVNMGDTYAPTVLFDVRNERFHVTTWGDWVEAQERRGRRFP